MDKILKYTTLIYALLIFVGCTMQYFFFLKFKINIIGYLSFNDAILSFLPTIFFLSILFFVACSILYFYDLWIHKKIQGLTRKIQGLLIFIGILLLFIFPCVLLSLNFSHHKVVLYYILLVFPIFIYLLYNFLKKKDLYNKIVWKYIYVIFILAMSIILSSLYATTKSDDLIKGRSIIGNVSFIYEEQNIGTNKDIILIGSTSDHIFLYDKAKKEASVYEKSNITFLKFRN